MKISKMANAVTPSLTRNFFDRALETGGDIINLTLGDPDILPPEEIRAAACEAIMAGKTRYSENAGLASARMAYARFFCGQYGLDVDPGQNIIVTVGGMEALFLSIASVVDHGDEVVVFGPYYANYVQMVNMCGGRVVTVDRLNKTDSEVISMVESALTAHTVAIIINSPCNPTGDILSPGLLDALASIAKSRDLYVISDEVYNSLVYDGKDAESIINRNGMAGRTIVIDSCSKRFAMTGWRIGFAVGPEGIISNMVKMQENVAACAPLPSQYAAIRAYAGGFDYSYIRKEYQCRRDLVYEALLGIPSISCARPDAAFYCFVDVGATGLDSWEFASALLEEEHVAVAPGMAYGEGYENYVRVAFTLRRELLQEAMERLSRFCGGV